MQCITAIAFAKNDMELLNCPCWVMIINIVAMDMLKSKMPPVSKRNDIRNRPRIPIPDEDPYSVAGSGSSGGSSSSHNGNSTALNPGGPSVNGGVNPAGPTATKDRRSTDKPPKLPPRDSGIYGSNIPKVRNRSVSFCFSCFIYGAYFSKNIFNFIIISSSRITTRLMKTDTKPLHLPDPARRSFCPPTRNTV